MLTVALTHTPPPITCKHHLQLGNRATTISVNTPVAVQNALYTFASLSSGFTASCGVDTAGVGYCWGEEIGRWGWMEEGDMILMSLVGKQLSTIRWEILHGGDFPRLPSSLVVDVVPLTDASGPNKRRFSHQWSTWEQRHVRHVYRSPIRVGGLHVVADQRRYHLDLRHHDRWQRLLLGLGIQRSPWKRWHQ